MDAYEMILQKVNLVDYINEFTELNRFPDGTYRGVCPLHTGANNPTSFMVTPRNNTFYCNSCGIGGNIVNFVQNKENFTFYEALDKLADYANIDLKQDGTFRKNREVAKGNEHLLSAYKKEIAVAMDYLTDRRGLLPEVIDKFDLGWDSVEQAIVIPIRDIYHRVVAFSRRYMNGEVKYRNTRNNDLYDKSRVLFNMNNARSMIKDRLYLVEGYMDAISGYQQGEAVVAYCSSEPTKEHIMMVKEIVQDNPNIIIMIAPDNDEVGQNKLIKIREKFNQYAPKLNVKVVDIPKKFPNCGEPIKDFNDVVKYGFTVKELTSVPINMHVLKTLLSRCPTPKAEYMVVDSFIKTVTNDMEKYDIAEMLHTRWNKPLDIVYKYLDMKNMSDDDVMEEFKDVDQCMMECRDTLLSGGLTLGFPGIDQSIRGARKTDVLIWGGYSGTFKTFYALEMCLHLAIRLKQNVIMFSLEMPAGGFYERLVANVMGISSDELIKQFQEDEIFALIFADIRNKLKSRIRVIDRNNLSLTDMERRIKIANTRIWDIGQTDVIIIDYFQYLKGTKNYEEASQTARGLKELAKGNNVLVVCLSQLSRQGSQWEKPTMQMLKGTGDLEASADIIIMAWRPGLDPSLSKIKADELEDVIGIFIAKGRRGVVVNEFRHKFFTEKTKIMEITY